MILRKNEPSGPLSFRETRAGVISVGSWSMASDLSVMAPCFSYVRDVKTKASFCDLFCR